jgi:hypothetical protein
VLICWLNGLGAIGDFIGILRNDTQLETDIKYSFFDTSSSIFERGRAARHFGSSFATR